MSDLDYKSNKKTCECPKHLPPRSPSLRRLAAGLMLSSVVASVCPSPPATWLHREPRHASRRDILPLPSVWRNSFVPLRSSVSAEEASEEETDRYTYSRSFRHDDRYFFNYRKKRDFAHSVFYIFGRCPQEGLRTAVLSPTCGLTSGVLTPSVSTGHRARWVHAARETGKRSRPLPGRMLRRGRRVLTPSIDDRGSDVGVCCVFSMTPAGRNRGEKPKSAHGNAGSP